MIHKHTGRWMWQGSASVISWNGEKYTCHSKLVSTLSMLLLSVLSWVVIEAWNPHHLYLSPGTWSLRPFQASARLLWSLYWCHWCCLSSACSSRHWSPRNRLWRLCQDAQLNLPVLLPFLLSHRCYQQSGNWLLFSLQCWQCLRDLLRRLLWSCSRNMLKKVDESRHPRRTPTVLRNQSPMLMLKRTALVALS